MKAININFLLVYEHLIIVLVATVIAVFVGVILGVLAYWHKLASKVIIWVVDTVQIIPSLALLSGYQ